MRISQTRSRYMQNQQTRDLNWLERARFIRSQYAAAAEPGWVTSLLGPRGQERRHANH